MVYVVADDQQRRESKVDGDNIIVGVNCSGRRRAADVGSSASKHQGRPRYPNTPKGKVLSLRRPAKRQSRAHCVLIIFTKKLGEIMS